ncbi:MAG: UDP-4-amino-4,6-dideoxy-N-acetyl-beta-L-altrosamine transaminase [Chromatiales bacterium]|jgi:UDP-4-amino-4,6-dideoxy-N-acetyl-beta-L-altrosamine transaminase
MHARRFIPYGTQWLGDEEINAVVEVLKGDWLSPGPYVDAFEEAMAEYCGARHAVAFSSGTAALHGAVFAAGLQPGQRGITSPFSWVASANCIAYQNGHPAFADVDAASMNLSPDKLQAAITGDTRLVIPVHFAGLPCDMQAIRQFADAHDLTIIEDAAHALGATSRHGKVGDCRYSDMVCFSFHPVKHITTGEGGMVLTNNTDLTEQLRRFRNHGIVRADGQRFPDEGPWYFEMQQLGYNYRMTNFQAAIGFHQLKKLDAFVARRHEICARYDEAFQNVENIGVAVAADGYNSSRHLYVIRLQSETLQRSKKQIVEQLKQAGLGVQVHYPPIHTQPYYREHYGYQAGDFPVAEQLYRESLSIPLYPKMTDDDVEYVIETISNVTGRFGQA